MHNHTSNPLYDTTHLCERAAVHPLDICSGSGYKINEQISQTLGGHAIHILVSACIAANSINLVCQGALGGRDYNRIRTRVQ